MKQMIVLCLLFTSACSTLQQPQGFVQPLPTAFIDQSYPTVESAPAAAVQSSSGIDVSALRAWRDGKDVNAEVCFTLIDGSDWSIWGASLQYGEIVVFDFASTMLSLQEPLEGQSGLRCDMLSFFNIPPDADLSSVTITVDAIAASPRREERDPVTAGPGCRPAPAVRKPLSPANRTAPSVAPVAELEVSPFTV